MTVKTSVSLTDEQEAFARGLVERGEFSSLSAVLQRGLEMLRGEREVREAELEGLRVLIDRRREGEFVELKVGEAETRQALRDKRKARAAV